MKMLTAAVALAATTSLSAQISHTHLSSIQSANQAGEICAFDPGSGRCFVTNPDSSALDVFATSPSGSLSYVMSIALSGQPNSVAVKNGLVAVAVEGATGQDLGAVQFFDAATGAASGPAVTVGAMPDMVAFTPDGTRVLTANEGEADMATGLINPEGSVSIVDVASRTAMTASFVPWNGQKAALKALGVRISDVNGITLAQDLEPEYLTIDPTSSTAYVTMQEANAIAVVDIATATVTDILPLGTKDHSLPGNALDASNQDGIDGNLQNYAIRGIFMPDAVCSFTIGGVTYLATANEGDSRGDFPGFEDETRGASLDNNFDLDCEDPTPETGLYTLTQLNDNAVLGRLNFVTGDNDLARGDTDGDGDLDQLYCFGGRSFTIWTTAGAMVFDSGSQIEQEMLARGLWQEGRSDDKGPEPESVTFGVVNGTPILFVGLERTNAVMLYDVSNPAAPTLLDVIDIAGEDGLGSTAPEGLQFVAASDNPTGRALLAVSCEGNGSLGLFAIDAGIAVANAFGSGCPAAQPLTLSSNLPQLASTWTLDATNVQAGASFCTFWFGEQALPAALELTALNSPGCFAYIEPSLGGFVAPIANGAASYPVTVPAVPALLAYALTAQVSTFDGSSFATSNGLAAVVGN
ncbi:MAG: choice-of-anchor I family protein [Planctomycetota bacterium]